MSVSAVFALLAASLAILAGGAKAEMQVIFEPALVKQLKDNGTKTVTVWANESFSFVSVFAASTHPDVAEVSLESLNFELVNGNHSKYKANFTVSGKFVGYTDVILKTFKEGTNVLVDESPALFVSVIRASDGSDAVFIGTISVMMFFMYINFGCALNMPLVLKNLKKPIGITIGLVSQFVFMPVMSFFIARYVFYDNPALQLGLFFIGSSPGGAASNMWTLVLGGNLDLSVTMTAVSTFASFLTIPFWVFTLGRLIFENANIAVPYKEIAFTALSLFIPLLIGIFIQYKLPKVTTFLNKVLKPFAAICLIFIIFATCYNVFLFKFVTWKLLFGASSNPILGYIFGAGLARIFRQSGPDILAISIETGIQNGAIAMILLKVALEPPESDISAVVIVTIFVATQLPLAILLAFFKIRDCVRAKKKINIDLNETEIPLKQPVPEFKQ